MKKITGLEFLAVLFNGFIGAILLVDSIKNGSNGYIYASVVCLLASFISGLCAQRGHEITKLTQEYADVNHQRLQALKEKDEADQQLSLLRQKYSRTNQPRSGGKFVKKTKQVSALSLKQICENNLGVARPSEMSNGEISKVCGYSLDYDCLIFGLDSYAGFTTFPDTSVIFNEYKSYEYGRL